VPVDPRDAATPEIAAVYRAYPHIGHVLPALGYGAGQLSTLRATIEACHADAVVAATPIDLGRLIHTSKPIHRARYEYADAGSPTLAARIGRFLAERKIAPGPSTC
jgi:predicted GTPase